MSPQELNATLFITGKNLETIKMSKNTKMLKYDIFIP